MFRTTFLGHQSWLVGSEQTRVLIDPLLTEGLGALPEPALDLFPPREIDLSAFPPIDAVIISHEHEDHFDVRSLDLLDRRTRVLISSRSSVAARETLREMGFNAELLIPKQTISLGDLRIHPFAVRRWPQPFEWDVVPFAIEHAGNEGSFFTTVDVEETRELLAEVQQTLKHPGIWTYANNFMDRSTVLEWLAPETDAVSRIAKNWADSYQAAFSRWTAPAAVLAYGGGFNTRDDLTWMNSHIWAADGEDLCREAQKLARSSRFIAPMPGQTVVLRDYQFVGIESESFIRTRARDQWPVHDSSRTQPRSDFAPATKQRSLSARDWSDLVVLLDEFARFLYSGEIFQSVLGLSSDDARGLRPTFALVLRDDQQRRVFEYCAQSCGFVEVGNVNNAREIYLAGAELWSSDLLALLRGEITGAYVLLGRMLAWNHAPRAFRFDFEMALFTFVHPLRLPRAFKSMLDRLHAHAMSTNKPPLGPVREKP